METTQGVDLTRLPDYKKLAKDSLEIILMDLELADAGELSPEEAKAVFRRLTCKVDAIYERIRDQEFRELRLKEDSKRDYNSAKVVYNKVKNLKIYIKRAMSHTGQDKIYGEKYSYTLSRPKQETITTTVLTFGDGIKNNQKLLIDFMDGPMVNVNLSWNEDVIIETLKNVIDPEERRHYEELFTIEDVTTPTTRALRSGVITG